MGRLYLFLLSLMAFLWGGELRVYFLDVGEGESVLIETPDDKRIIIDTGNLITGYRVYQFIKSKGIEEIDMLIVTHPHPDHMGGVFLLLQAIKVKRWCDNGQPINRNNNDLYRWYEEIFRRGNYCVLKGGDILKMGGVEFHILNPFDYGGDWNTNSLVIKMTYKKVSFLFTGDADITTERKLIERYGESLKSDVLKVGHHGASDSTSKEFLKMVRPSYAVISINNHNIRGFPSDKTLKLLKDMKVKTYITYRDGTVLFISDGERVEVFRRVYNF